MKNNIDDTTPKLDANNNSDISTTDKPESGYTKIIEVSVEVAPWYSIVNLIYSLLVGYVWIKHIMGSPASGNVLRLIDSIFVWMALWIPHAVKVEPLKALCKRRASFED